jgi:hypothetical protein
MKISEVEKVYLFDRNGRVRGYRHKGATEKHEDQ